MSIGRLVHLSHARHADRIARLPSDSPAITRRSGIGLWVDSAHEHYAATVRPGVVTPAQPSPWDPIHRWAAVGDVSTPEQVRQGLLRLPDQLPAWCRPRCHEQLAKLSLADPPPAGSRLAVCRHVLGWQNGVRARTGGTPAKRHPIPYGVAAWRYGWPLPDGPLDTFASVHVISLHRTPERLTAFEARFPSDWPFACPRWFSAVDGTAEPPPATWWPDAYHGLRCGAWGCRRSHLAVMRQAIAADDGRPVLILEDDFEATPDFAARSQAFMAALPDDWEIAYLGCQHLDAPTPAGPGVLRVNGAERTHAMAVHPRAFGFLADLYGDGPHHIDWQLRDIAKHRRFYAADPPLAAQGENTSTIEGSGSGRFGRRDWSRSPSAFGTPAEERTFRAKLAARQTAPWPDGPPAVFYHVACMNNWRAVVREQCRLLAHVGLLDVTAAVLGPPADVAEVGEIAAACGVRLAIGFTSPDLSLVELPTLQLVHRWAVAQAEPRPAMYLHTKGVSQPTDPHKGPWRRLMQRHVVADWRANVRRCRVADMVGVNWGGGSDYPHFSGNFWMARSDWLAALQEPSAYRVSRPDFTWAGGSWRGRFFAETWLGSRTWHHVESLACTGSRLWDGDAVFKFDTAVDGFDYDG